MVDQLQIDIVYFDSIGYYA